MGGEALHGFVDRALTRAAWVGCRQGGHKVRFSTACEEAEHKIRVALPLQCEGMR